MTTLLENRPHLTKITLVIFLLITAAALFGPSDTVAATDVSSDSAFTILPGDVEARSSKEVVAPSLTESDYRRPSGANTRVVTWLAAQIHLWFAAFVLAVPVFVVIIEALGMIKKDARYDRVAYEFLRVSLTAYSLTALTGAVFAGILFLFYPGLMGYLTKIFSTTIAVYLIFILLEHGALYIYYYSWKRALHGRKKRLHLGGGLLLNLAGVTIMFTANAWVTFMMTPGGVDIAGVFNGSLWEAVNNPLWNPINLHRFIANIAYGGSIVAAYAAYRFLCAQGPGERAHYDWMGYTSSYIAILALLPLPFAGYWLTAEIYAYSQQMGITLMGGLFGWLFVIQAVIIGALFLAANYYLWCSMERGPNAARYRGYIKYLAFGILVCFLIWFTPHTIAMKPAELSAIGSAYHPLLGPLGLMPAKNIAVNIMILLTLSSFLIYRRSNREPSSGFGKKAAAMETAILLGACINIIFLGLYYGYFTDSVYKVASSIPQVMTTLVAIIAITVIEFLAYRGAPAKSALRWGAVPRRSQYALILIAVSFTWLMGLMGFVRSAIRQHWHVYSVVRDSTPEAATPTIAYAAQVVSIGTVIFMSLIVFIFWLNRDETQGGRNS